MAVTVSITISDQRLREIKHLLSVWLRLDLTIPQIEQLLVEHVDIVLDVYQYGVLDQSIRDQIFDMLSEKLLGHSCPTYDERSEVDAFFVKLHKAAKSHGYEVIAISE